MMTFILANLILMALAATTLAAAVSCCRFLPRFRIQAALLIMHGAIVLGTVLPSAVGKGGGEFPFDDIYFPFLLYPGALLSWLNSRIAHLFWPWLAQHVGYHEGSYLCIVAIPAALTTIAGAFFWMVVGRLVQRIRRNHAANHASEPTSEPAPGAASSSPQG